MTERRCVLFLCTGNYYRSRYAEILFDYLVERTSLAWRADSRGLAPEMGLFHTYPMARHVFRVLGERRIDSPASQRHPRKVTVAELERADRVIALKEAEHRPLLADRFPGWENRVEYWHVHDIDSGSVADALAEIEVRVQALVDQLLAGES